MRREGWEKGKEVVGGGGAETAEGGRGSWNEEVARN